MGNCDKFPEGSSMLSPADQHTLVKIARSAIEAAVRSQAPPPLPALSDELRRPCGAFVTIHVGGALRGCIGFVESHEALAGVVRDTAAKAATEDLRFNPVTSTELSSAEIEISVISPLREITDIREIEIGKHGLLLTAGPVRGLLLPQVAVDHGWDSEAFLTHACIKAGIPGWFWKEPGTRLYVFTSDIINEKAL
jgi:AmmeMemoRadiSam system protein A